MIISKNNAKIKNLRKLIEQSKARKEEGLFVIEGARIMSEAPPELVREVYVSESFKGDLDLSIYPNVEYVSNEVFRSISDTVNPQGIAAVLAQPAYNAESVFTAIEQYDALVRQSLTGFDQVGDIIAQMWEAKLGRFKILILDDIQDPGNLGTMIRTAEAAGVSLVVMSQGCADIFNPKVIRSTMGSIFRVPFIVTELVSEIEQLKIAGVQVVATALNADGLYNEMEYEPKVAVVIGNEGNGISKDVLNSVSCTVKIPMQGQVESLNAAVSAGVVLYSL